VKARELDGAVTGLAVVGVVLPPPPGGEVVVVVGGLVVVVGAGGAVVVVDPPPATASTGAMEGTVGAEVVMPEGVTLLSG